MNPVSTGRVKFTRDEVANVLTHGLGCLLSLAAIGYFAWTTAGLPAGLRVSCLIYAGTMSVVYFCSTLSHAVLEYRARTRCRAWDQGTIYLLIAGTYTPFIWYGSPPGWTAVVMSSVWLAAGLGFYSKVVARYRIEAISTLTYVLLGWLPALPLVARTPTVCVNWMVLGGLSYTLGIVFLISSSRFWYAHALWHLAVMLGSLCHFIAINSLIPLA